LNSSLRKQKYGKRLLELAVFLIAAFFIFPVWMVVVNSFKTEKEAAFFGLGFPDKWQFVNYAKVFAEANIVQAMSNGLLLTGVIGALALLFASMAAFAISRIGTKFTSFAYYLFMSGIVLPGAIIPTFFLLQRLNLINTYTGVIVVLLSMTMPVSVFLYTGFMKSVPKELDEAGIIDGCGKLRLFFVIILPLLRPATITVMIFNFMGVWNDVTTQLYFSNADKWTMPMMVYRFQGMYSSQWNLIFADLILTSIPVVLVYIIGQKYMVSGLTTGAVKG